MRLSCRINLHSAIAQTRRFERSEWGRRKAIRFATIDSTTALMAAFFINAAVMRRLVTRGLAILPALAVTVLCGEAATGRLLVFSQVVLSLQLSFAVAPLVMFISDRSLMGAFVNPRGYDGRAVAPPPFIGQAIFSI